MIRFILSQRRKGAKPQSFISEFIFKFSRRDRFRFHKLYSHVKSAKAFRNGRKATAIVLYVSILNYRVKAIKMATRLFKVSRLNFDFIGFILSQRRKAAEFHFGIHLRFRFLLPSLLQPKLEIFYTLSRNNHFLLFVTIHFQL